MASASWECLAPKSRSRRWRERPVRAGITAGRRASMPGSRKPTITSRRRSRGPMPRMWRRGAAVSRSGGGKSGKMGLATVVGWWWKPLLGEGQIVGGAAQGIGGALLEEFNYDPDGQQLAGSFMDYMLPTACEIPDMQLIHQHSPSPLNPLGVKGVGEGGPIAPPAVIANAVSDALRPFAVEFNRTPIKPQIIQQALRSASQPR